MKIIHTLGKRSAAMVIPVLACALIASVSAHAEQSKFGVRVVDDAGEPVSGASVCIGLPGNFKQFGALFTNADGEAIVEVPNVPLVVTVSKTRFSGLRISEPARGFNLVRELTLTEGTPGPRCRAGSSMAANPPQINIANVDVMEKSNRTVLMPKVTGEPNHYRVSTSPDFDDANWKSFDNAIALSAAYADEPAVFLQMRRFEGRSNAWVESRSRIVNIRLTTVQ